LFVTRRLPGHSEIQLGQKRCVQKKWLAGLFFASFMRKNGRFLLVPVISSGCSGQERSVSVTLPDPLRCRVGKVTPAGGSCVAENREARWFAIVSEILDQKAVCLHFI
jgi:hypothetical protein